MRGASHRDGVPSVAVTLDRLVNHLPPGLAAATVLARVSDAFAFLPAPVADWIYLEFRLGADAAGGPDVILGVSEGGRRILAGSCVGTPLDVPQHAHPIWRRIGDLCRRWIEPTSAVGSGLERIWLEFDSPHAERAGTATPWPVPGVFVDFAEAACRDAAAVQRLLTLTVDTLGEQPLDAATRLALARVLDALPPGAFAPYLGIFPARSPRALRVCVAGIQPAMLPCYLRDAGWPGDPAALGAAMAELAGRGAPCPQPRLLHLDLAPQPLPRIGIEYVLLSRPQVRGVIVEGGFIEALEAAGLCSAAERAALSAWPGCVAGRLEHELWPALLIRHVNHVKLVFDGGRPSQAKAYLAFHAQPRRHAHRGRPASLRGRT